MAHELIKLQQRFESLLSEHKRIAFHVARMYSSQADERQDLIQEMFAQLWRAFPSYDEQRRFSTWMYRIVLNVGISHLRQVSDRPPYLHPLDDHYFDALQDPSSMSEPDARLVELDKTIAKLAPMNRALIMLYLDERPYAEIAEILGITETNVATKIGRIKSRLREQMTGGNNQKAEGE